MTPPVAKERLLALVPRLAGRRVVVAGDYVLDRFLYGHPKRVSREAPVLILRFWKEENLPGGAGNTAANVRALGGVPLPVGATGDDPEGRTLRTLLRDCGIEVGGLFEVRGYRTPTKTRILGGAPHGIKQQIVRYDREEPLPADPPLKASLLRQLRRSADGAHAAILSDYGYGAISAAAVSPLRKELGSQSPVLVDSRHRLPEYREVDAATPNEEELEAYAGAALGDSPEQLARAAGALRRELACQTLLVTRGSRGMALFHGDDAPVLIPVHGTDQVADVTGAGDTVLAAFGLALASGATPLEAALLANFAGGVVVMKMGTAVVTPAELTQAIAADRTILAT
jgi:rfaE bifunctional protein kinase chain/domain